MFDGVQPRGYQDGPPEFDQSPKQVREKLGVHMRCSGRGLGPRKSWACVGALNAETISRAFHNGPRILITHPTSRNFLEVSLLFYLDPLGLEKSSLHAVDYSMTVFLRSSSNPRQNPGPGVVPFFPFLGSGFPSNPLKTQKGTLSIPRLPRG